MTKEKLSECNRLSAEILKLENLISGCKSQKTEWIEFTFGNGSNRVDVCNDESIIKKVRELIILESELKLDQLKVQFLNI